MSTTEFIVKCPKCNNEYQLKNIVRIEVEYNEDEHICEFTVIIKCPKCGNEIKLKETCEIPE